MCWVHTACCVGDGEMGSRCLVCKEDLVDIVGTEGEVALSQASSFGKLGW